MLKKVIITCALITFILIAAAFVVESVKDNPKNILKNISTEKEGVKYDRALPREGERLSYLIKYLGIIPVAPAEIEIGEKENYKNHRVYPLTARGRVSDFISRFIKAEGVITSYVDVSKLYPWRYEEKSHAEGHRPSDKAILYHQYANVMEFKDIKRKIPENTQDPLSALFFLRWQEYEEDKDVVFNVNSNKENYTLDTKLLRQKTVKHERFERKLLVLLSHIKSPKKYSKSEARVTTYVTGDAARLPILLKLRTKFGPLVIRLTDVKYR